MKTKTFALKIKNGKLIIPSEIKNYLINCSDNLEVSLTIKSESNLSNSWDKWFEEVEKIEPINNNNQSNKYEDLLIDKYKKQGLDL